MDTSEKINERISSYGDWRSDRLRELRKLVNEAAPELIEDFKWGVPVWTYNGMACAISGFKDHVKINFFKGAYLSDPKKLFNSGLDSKEHRSINFARNDKLDRSAIADLVRSAIAYNKGK
ncbi:MAG: DUF1801 domain-containing protein [Patescibacteria group bacterium]